MRSFTWGSALQLGKVSRLLLAELARRACLLPGAGVLAFIDVDSTQRRVYGHAKQGAAFGDTKIQGTTVLVRGLNALVATVCTLLAAPVIAATRLRGGNASSARGVARFIAEAAATARDAGCTGTVVVRMDSAYYSAAACHATRRAGAVFSVTARLDPAVRAAIAGIGEGAWTPRAPDQQVRTSRRNSQRQDKHAAAPLTITSSPALDPNKINCHLVRGSRLSDTQQDHRCPCPAMADSGPAASVADVERLLASVT